MEGKTLAFIAIVTDSSGHSEPSPRGVLENWRTGRLLDYGRFTWNNKRQNLKTHTSFPFICCDLWNPVLN